MKTFIFNSLAVLLLLLACSDDMVDNEGSKNTDPDSMSWLIPKSEVRDGGPGKDGIPALIDPSFDITDEVSWLNDDDLVLAFADEQDIRAYPHPILDWHEIINDKTENHSVAIVYCPLTGTGIGWNRIINNSETSFGVSGLLYNSNIIPYDRTSDSNWSQLLMKCVNGRLSGQRTENYNLLETSWATWKKMYPSSKIVSKSTGHNRAYGSYPYGSHREDEGLIFPVSNTDHRLHAKERVLCIFNNGITTAFTFDKLNASNNLIINNIGGNQIVIAGSKQDNLMVAFHTKIENGVQLDFQIIENSLPELLLDNEGNTWDVFGRAIKGERRGEHLKPVTYMMGYWFSFAAFYPNIEIFE